MPRLLRILMSCPLAGKLLLRKELRSENPLITYSG